MKRHTVPNTLLLSILLLSCATQVHAAHLPDPPPARSRKEIEAVLAKAPKLQPPNELKELNVVLVADKKDHGPSEHDYPLWQERWRTLLSDWGPVHLHEASKSDAGWVSMADPVKVTTTQGWPNKQQFASADVIVVFCYIDWDEQKLSQVKRYLNRGGGFVLIHSATWAKPEPSEEVARLTGCGGFSKWRHGPIKLKITDRDHPICVGLPEQIEFIDESYWPPTPKVDGVAMNVLATSDEKMNEESAGPEPQPMFWTYEQGKGRVFGCILGHYTWTFDDLYFRLLLLRGMAWSANADEPPYRFDSLALRGIKLKD